MHLRHVGAGFGAPWLADVLEAQFGQLRVAAALASEFRTRALQALTIATFLDPAGTQCGQAFQQVNFYVRVSVGTGGVVHGNRRIILGTKTGSRTGLLDLAHTYTNIRTRTFHVYFS